MSKWRDAAELASRQHGLVARRQLVKLGIADQSVRERVARDGWRRVQRGVYALPGSQGGFEQEVMAAVLLFGDAALASHLTAAYLHGVIAARPPVIDILLPYQHRSRLVDGIHVTRSRTLRPVDRCLVGQVPATTLPRTVIDSATVLEPPGIRAMLIDARQQRRMDLARVARRLLDMGPVRHSGELRRQIGELDRHVVDSVLEGDVRKLLRDAGLPPPHPKPYPVRVAGRTVAVDIAWPELQIGIEVDGYGSHSSRRAMDNDHRKQNALVRQGWQILRVSWDRVVSDPDGFVAEVTVLLRASL